MKHSFKKHYKEARLTVKQTLKNKKNYLIYYTNLFMNLFTILVFVLRPLYKLCNLRMLRNMKEDNQLCISKSLEAADKPKTYWTYIINFATKLCLFLAIVLMHGVAIVLLYILGLVIYYILNSSDLSIVIFIFAIPAVVALAAFVLFGRYFICPTAYILEANQDIKCSSALYLSLVSNKKQGKLALFLNSLTYKLKYVFYILVVYLVINIISGGSFTPLATVILTNLILLVAIAGFLWMLPKESLTYRLIRFNIYNDLITDSLSMNALTTGIRFEEVRENKDMTETLLSIFENTSSFNLKEKKAIKEMPKFSGDSSLIDKKEEIKEQKDVSQEQAVVANEVNVQQVEQNTSDSVQEVVTENNTTAAKEEQIKETVVAEEKTEQPIEEKELEEKVEPVVETAQPTEQTETDVKEEQAVETEQTEPEVQEVVEEVEQAVVANDVNVQQVEQNTSDSVQEVVQEQQPETVEETLVEVEALDLAEAMNEVTEEPQKENEEREEE